MSTYQLLLCHIYQLPLQVVSIISLDPMIRTYYSLDNFSTTLHYNTIITHTLTQFGLYLCKYYELYM